jgi:hypothetical protein
MHERVTPDYHGKQSDLRPLWAITWRSIVLIPFVLVFGIVLVAVALSLVVLPFFVAAYIYHHLWQQALEYSAAWLLLFCVWWFFQLRRFFEWPPSVL